MTLIDKEIGNFLDNKIISKCLSHENKDNQFISHIFFRYKSNGNIRVILNLKPFNLFIENTHFKMGGLADAINLTYKNCFFTSIDLKDAFYTVPLHHSAKKYFRFYHKSELFEFNSLVMGYKDAPRIFTKITKPLLSVLRQQNIQIMMYIDDSLLVHSSYDEGLQATRKTLDLMNKLGFYISWDKSCLIPTQRIKYLGFLIDSTNMTVRPTEEKALAIKAECAETKSKTKITIRKLAELIGKFMALCPGNRFGTIFYKRSENEKTKLLNMHSYNFDAKNTISDVMIEDFAWWEINAISYPVYFQLTLPVIEITCDSSTTGWAGICNSVTTKGLWSTEEQADHINILEIKAALLSLKAFTTNKSDISVKIFSDNICTVLCINKQGSTKTQINALIRDIWLYCLERNIFLKAIHVPGKDNKADEGSRNKGAETEWELRNKEFEMIEDKFGPFDCDMFASRINKKVNRYVSWHKDSEAWQIDAFSFSWSGTYSFMFPPFSLILRTLQKIQLDIADCVLLIPWWKAQIWVPKLTSLLTDIPLMLPKTQKLLQHPSIEGSHPILKKTILIACRLSGNCSKTKEFQRIVLKSSWPHGESVPENNTRRTLKDGFYFVINNKKIPFRQLHKT